MNSEIDDEDEVTLGLVGDKAGWRVRDTRSEIRVIKDSNQVCYISETYLNCFLMFVK